MFEDLGRKYELDLFFLFSFSHVCHYVQGSRMQVVVYFQTCHLKSKRYLNNPSVSGNHQQNVFVFFSYWIPFADDNGWEVCQQYLGPSEECNPGDSEEEQQRPELWGAVQERLHNGPPQARREAVHRPAGGRHWTPHQQSKTDCFYLLSAGIDYIEAGVGGITQILMFMARYLLQLLKNTILNFGKWRHCHHIHKGNVCTCLDFNKTWLPFLVILKEYLTAWSLWHETRYQEIKAYLSELDLILRWTGAHFRWYFTTKSYFCWWQKMSCFHSCKLEICGIQIQRVLHKSLAMTDL